MMKSCANCKFLGQNFSKLNNYQQSVASPETDFTCQSGQGFTSKWLFGNPDGGMQCGGNYYQKNTDEESVAKVVDLQERERQRIYQKILNRKME